MGLVSAEIFHYIQRGTNVAWTNVAWTNVSKKVDNSYRWPSNRVWLQWEWYQLRYSIIFKPGQMYAELQKIGILVSRIPDISGR